VAENLIPFLIDKDLGRDELDLVFSRRLGVFPDIIEDDLDTVGKGFGDILHDRLPGSAADAAVGAELYERHKVLGKVDVQTVRDKDFALDRPDRRIGLFSGAFHGKAGGTDDRQQGHG
jgi:hypothetical protein